MQLIGLDLDDVGIEYNIEVNDDHGRYCRKKEEKHEGTEG